MTRKYEACVGSLNKKKDPQNGTAEGVVRDPDRLTEPVWARRANDATAGVSSSPAGRAPWGKAGRLRVQGFSIGTSEPACSRRSVADRLALRSREMAARGGGGPVVVGGRESRPQGEGDQVVRGECGKEK